MAKKKIDKLTKNQLARMELYIQLTANKFGKTKKSRYEDIYRHEAHYREYIAEIVGEEE
jgi:hypothetical protein